jgi:hypothetical protein
MALLITALRWIICIPLGVLAGAAVQLIYLQLNHYIEAGTLIYFVESMVAGGLAGAAAIYVATYIVPSHKLLLAILLCCLSFYGMYLSLQNVHADGWSYLSLNAAQIAGTIYMTYLIFSNKVTFDTASP